MAGIGTAHLRPAGEAVLRVEDLVVEFPARGGRHVHAVSGISLDVVDGETLGLVGESGCGKSSTGRAIVQLPRPTGGHVLFGDHDLAQLPKGQLRELRPQIQLIYQDPISSLNPRRTIAQIIEEPLKIWKQGDADARRAKVDEILEAVGIDPAARTRKPHEFSGGQCQRISIARALVLDPKVLICDEPVSALDVSVQAQILNLLEDMKERYGLTMVFISHDLGVVRNVSDRVMVMYLGKTCEIGPPDDLFDSPAHPYTAALLSAVPEPDPHARGRAVRLAGELPSPVSPPSGCRFRTRCPRAEDRCAAEEPVVRPLVANPEHFVACHFPLEEAEPESSTPQSTRSISSVEVAS